MVETKETQAGYYDELFRDFEYANSLQLSRAICILEALLATGVNKPHILDFGCGAGWLSNILSTFGPTVGVDLSSQAIASKRYPAPKFEAVDIFQWDHPAGAFDVVVSQEVLEHVEDQHRYIQLAARLLRDRGFLILTTPNAATMMAMPEQQRKIWSDQPIENWLTPSELRGLLRSHFGGIHLKTVIFGMGSNGAYRLVNSTKLVRVMAKLGLEKSYDWIRGQCGFGLHIVATARKL